MLDFGIAPLDFEATHFEKNLYLRRGALREGGAAWADLDVLLYQIEPREPLVTVFRQGPMSPQAYVESAIEFGMPRLRFNKAKLYELLGEGATLVINRIENFLPAARELCSDVCRFTGHQSISNGYLSFCGDGTFGHHWDTHDVFAIQLLGRKRWQVFGPTLALPLSHQKSERREHECPPQPILDCILETGDLLYVPRGWWHRAVPLDEGSFHVSVGTYAPTLYDYLMWMSTRFLPQQHAARKALSRIEDSEEIANVLRQFSVAALDPLNVGEFARDMQSRERTQTQFNLEMFLTRNDSELPSHATLSVNGNCYHVGSHEILANGHRWRTSVAEDATLRILNSHARMSFSELAAHLPQISAEALTAAVKSLAKREVLTVRLPMRRASTA